jgi:hypothetical protein
MGLLSVQSDIARQYLGSSMNRSLDIPPGGGYRDMTGAAMTNDMPLSYGSSTAGTFASRTAWRTKHGGVQALQGSTLGSVYNFNTNQVDPSVR